MSRQHHILKTETEYYQMVEKGKKMFEIRKNDRDFKRYDMVKLIEVVNGIETGRSLGLFEVVYVLKDVPEYGLKPGYCILQLKY